jgi:hypothetical protein
MTKWGVYLGVASITVASACGDSSVVTSVDQEQLWAILHDEELTTVSHVATGLANLFLVAPAAFQGTFGQWSFDDCNADRTNLADSGPNFNTGFRSVGVTCAPGIAGQAVALAVKEDLVYVPDQPGFTFENGVTVAGWFNPSATDKTRTLIRKRDKGTSSFALVLNNGKYQFVANLGGKAISVTAPHPAEIGVFHHLAGTYDGNTLRLYLDGFEVRGLGVGGTIPPGPGPLLIGNDGSERRFDGLIDNVIFEGRALTNAEVLALTCFRSPATLVVSPLTNDSTPPGATATFDLAVTNHDLPSCGTTRYQAFVSVFIPDISVNLSPFESDPVPGGGTTHFTLTATPDDNVEPGTFQIAFEVFGGNTFLNDSVELVVTEPAGCHVRKSHELMIKTISVADDPVRTRFAGDPSDPRTGAWTFKRLIENMAPTPEDAPSMVLDFLTSFTVPQTIDGFTIDPRPRIQSLIDFWPRTPDGALDLAQAPVQLLAIVNRFDLRDLANGDAGEARFVFNFTFFGNSTQANLILEYKLPAATAEEVLGWAQAFHGLGAIPFSEDYNVALQAITDRFAGRGARPAAVNGSALSALRTNEIDFGDNFLWQMREFALSPDTGRIVPATIKLTPDRSFDGTDTLAAFIDANQAAIIAETHVVPDTFNGQPFRAGAVFNDTTTWFAPGVDGEARHHFALNTCNGCHSQQETGILFTHINPRSPGTGVESALSPFLTGVTVSDPVTGQPRTFNDLARRAADLDAVVCAQPGANLAKGISRVH